MEGKEGGVRLVDVGMGVTFGVVGEGLSGYGRLVMVETCGDLKNMIINTEKVTTATNKRGRKDDLGMSFYIIIRSNFKFNVVSMDRAFEAMMF